MTISRRKVLLGGFAAALLAACSNARTARAGAPASSSTSTPPTTSPRLAPTVAPVVPAGPARFIRSGPSRKTVALTFHGSGDLGLTQRLLDGAKRAGAPITVFAVGQWLEANPQMATAIQSGGHELANHTYTHPPLKQVGRADLVREITKCRDVLKRETGSAGRWFRPSGTDTPTQAMLDEAGAAGYPVVVGYDIDPLDYQDPGAPAVLQRVKAALHPGAIVSLHTGHPGTVDAFEPIVTALRAAGLEPVLLRDHLA
ncbi:MAG: polysaccharide deacetylase family protein [Actinomycetota bacterium]|nr:polysaccharide deacetylase family protein [Actinomycetota bacterium]